MVEIVKLYKKISLELIDELNKEEFSKVEEFLNKRQEILDQASNPKNLKQLLIDDGILGIDKEIHRLLSENISKVKNELKEHRLSQQANNSYTSFNKEKLNIFNKKV